MDQTNLYDTIRELLGNLHGNFNILEEQIDIDLQLEYFESSKDIKKSIDRNETLNNMDDLFSNRLTLEEKKSLLIRLASIDNVEAFRSIEKYNSAPDPLLKDWSTLAMQESRMLLESSFLDQNQVFISTGLGGKGKKLRYFIVFFAKKNINLNKLQHKYIQSEIEYFFSKNNAEIEKLTFDKSFCCIKAVIPLEQNINELFKSTINECNQMGDWLDENFIVTNVKELSFDEIMDIMESIKNNNLSDDPSESQ